MADVGDILNDNEFFGDIADIHQRKALSTIKKEKN